ncbi:T9SS type A sorting domain-containing protein [candidate division KSB1 bacterium]|nr:T9SS type A sorting domain-containing protein [candidate division KSB1 bacterium]
MGLIITLLMASVLAGATMPPDHPNFQYTGRIDFSSPDAPMLYWPGTSIKANFEGTSLSVLLNDQNGQSYYNVFIDEDYENPYIIECGAGNQSYIISSTLADTIHPLLIFRRTEASTGPTEFLGIEIDEGKTLLEPPERPEHRIKFYGNSITCGMGNEAPDSGSDDIMEEENNFLAYGAIASRLLDAEYMCIAKSGIGIMISWFNMIMPEYYYRLDPDDSESYWDFSLYVPDVVVINLFQNDSWLINNLNPIPNSMEIINAYVNFVRQIRTAHPTAYIVCSLGSMDATRQGSPWPGYIEDAVEHMQTEDDDANIDVFFFPFENWYKHPRVRHHLQMGEDLANFIGESTGWIDVSVDGLHLKTDSQPLFCLEQNYPNPFNASTQITFEIPQSGQVKLNVYNALGHRIICLVNENLQSGFHATTWNARDAMGKDVSSGIYFYSLTYGQQKNITNSKMLLMR